MQQAHLQDHAKITRGSVLGKRSYMSKTDACDLSGISTDIVPGEQVSPTDYKYIYLSGVAAASGREYRRFTDLLDAFMAELAFGRASI